VDIDKRQKVKAPRHLSQEDDHTVFISKHQITLELIAIADNKRYAFPCSHTIEIGRQQLDGQPAISKLHCKFSYHEDQLYIEDHHSQNHTFVNDVQIFETTKISEQDVIRLAGSSYQVRIRK
jgi:hypothetical protein